MSDLKKIGFVGTGVMGSSMAGHLLEAGHELSVYNRTKAKADTVIRLGATWCDSIAQIASRSEVIITIVGYPKDVEETYLGEEGLLENANPGTLLIDMTTSSPVLAVRIAEAAKAAACEALDAPVSGGDVGAKNAALSIMVGGSEEAYQTALPLFGKMGKNIVHQGGPGFGQHCKMANQIAIAAGMMGVCEAMAYARKCGLNPETVLKSIESGAAGSWSLSNLAPRMLAGNFDPGFYVKHFIKDLRIAIESAQAMELDTPGLELALSLYEKLAAAGHEDDGTQALFRLYLS